MAKFYPEPEVNQEYWASTTLYNVIGFDIPGIGDNQNLSLNKNSWVVYAFYTSEPFPAPMGYPVHFPTSTDCLLWIRWLVLPSFALTEEEVTGDRIVLKGDLKEFADEIDQAPENSMSEEILTKLTHKLKNLCESHGLYICFIGTVHDFLSTTGNVKGWRKALESDDIAWSNGIWEMPEVIWDSLREYIYDEDHSIINNEDDEGDGDSK